MAKMKVEIQALLVEKKKKRAPAMIDTAAMVISTATAAADASAPKSSGSARCDTFLSSTITAIDSSKKENRSNHNDNDTGIFQEKRDDDEEIKRSGGDSAQICRSTSPELSPQREGLDKNISMEPTLMGNDILNVSLGDDDDEDTVKSEQEAIRRHAARMLYWADKATERRGSGSSGSLRSSRSIEKSDSSGHK
uniref:Uncharacterized protein n=1 Tax=Ditylum brightwellii TaxID=49249 RepID=A0A6V2KH64_9STRA